jgi:hypothetical protein
MTELTWQIQIFNIRIIILNLNIDFVKEQVDCNSNQFAIKWGQYLLFIHPFLIIDCIILDIEWYVINSKPINPYCSMIFENDWTPCY